MVDYEQEALIENHVTNEPELTPIQEEKTPCVRLNPSNIENLSKYYQLYKESNCEQDFLNSLNYETPKSEKYIEKNAKSAIYGTLIHQLQYFSEIFFRAKHFNRLPNYEDFRTTFPNREDSYYDAMLKIMEYSTQDGISDNPLDNAQNFWNTWRLNGQVFTRKGHNNYVLTPQKIKDMWEDSVIPLEDIQEFRKNFLLSQRDRLDPTNTLIMNELMTVLKINFNGCAIQIPTYIDEIAIPKDRNDGKILEVVDYKTGKQLKEPRLAEKIQILQMLTNIWVNVTDQIKDINYENTVWNLVHDIEDDKFPYFNSKGLVNDMHVFRNIYFEDILDMRESICKHTKFKYVNPVSNEEIDINLEDVGLNNRKSLRDLLMYMNKITLFYIKYKDTLSHKIKNRRAPFVLPTFSPEIILNEQESQKENPIQISFNV